MIVTEKDANKFLCCGPQSARQMTPQFHCAGQKCMAWRWAVNDGASTQGYCGHIDHDDVVKTESVAGEGEPE